MRVYSLRAGRIRSSQAASITVVYDAVRHVADLTPLGVLRHAPCHRATSGFADSGRRD